jgi:hypothetical protein
MLYMKISCSFDGVFGIWETTSFFWQRLSGYWCAYPQPNTLHNIRNDVNDLDIKGKLRKFFFSIFFPLSTCLFFREIRKERSILFCLIFLHCLFTKSRTKNPAKNFLISFDLSQISRCRDFKNVG